MIRKLSYLTLSMALFATWISASSDVHAQRKKSKNTIRTAMLAPRGSVIVRSFKQIDRDMRKATGNEWGVRIYASGVAGDEKDVIRKMRVGQMDSAIITTTGLSQVVREVAIIDTPGIVSGYDDIKKIKKEMWKEWQDTFWKNNVKLIGWFPAGEYRIFSKGKIKDISDLKKHRPWLWPESFVLKELWRAIGATGVPLGVPDVYGALQTGMIDSYINSAVATVSMQWHTKVDHMTVSAKGVLLLAWVMNKDTWNKLPENARKIIEETVADLSKTAYEDAKREDGAAYKKLLKRGFKLSPEPKGLAKIEKMVRDRLTGRVFSKQLVDRLTKITGNN